MEQFGRGTTSDERTWGMFGHLSSLCAFIGIPFGNILGPLVIWLIKKEESGFVAYHAREALNFQITVMIYALVCIPLVFVLIGIPLLVALFIADIVLTIMAAVEANKGGYYTYPFTFRFIA